LDQLSGKGIQHHFNILKHNEQTKDYFQRIKQCEGKSRGGAVDKIMIEEEDGRQHIVFDKHAIEREIMKVNEEKLLQASNTPLRSEQLSILLGEQGDYDKWEEVLQGCIKLPQNVDEGLRVWYEYITHMSQHDSIQFSWTTEEYCESWSKINENKSTLPGIQVAHIKSLTPNSIAADVVSKLALIPLLVGYSPKTWRNGIDSMIPKKVADLRPSKLRLILLLDARFNHNNKLIGKKMMEYGEQNGILAPEQFGSRKNLSAIDHATNKRLVLDILRQSKQNAVYIANDAKSCYDRIILMVAYLTMRNFGIPALAAKCTISTILRMQHRVRTCYGDSVEYYGGDKWQIKPHGCGQGNGYGPALWACISSPLLHIMRQQGHGTRLQRPISRSPLHIAAFAFVDDTDIIQTESNNTDRIVNDETFKIKELFQATQGATDTWSSILRATGGDLEPSKTFCVPILHKWQGSTSTLLSTMEDELQIHLMTSENQLLAIEKKDPNESFFTLGIWQSPSGDETAQKQYLLEKINDWNYKTNQRTLTWAQAQIASRSTIGKTLLYSLPVTAFEERECKELQKTYLRAMLGKIGVVWTAPAIIATAPLWLGGFGLLSFEIEQFVSHIGMLLQHGHQHTSLTGLLLRTSLEYYAVEAGLPGDPLRLPEVQYVTQQTWIFNTIKAMRTYRVHISSDIPSLLPWTTNDIFLMQLFDSQQISRGTLRTLNKVRLYLRVVTVSDLLSADGRIYDVNIVSGNRTTCHPTQAIIATAGPRYHHQHG
jgi:Reverse transcriptase (RNA-dependent DNA polymerase).